jgi:alkyldihydroxyacetonephosphate synthase
VIFKKIFSNFRYSIGEKPLPNLQKWAIDNFNIDPSKPAKIPELPTSYPESRLPGNIRQELEQICSISIDGVDRLIRAHGQTLKDISYLRNNSFPRIPDAIVWPDCHDQVFSSPL